MFKYLLKSGTGPKTVSKRNLTWLLPVVPDFRATGIKSTTLIEEIMLFVSQQIHQPQKLRIENMVKHFHY